MQNVIAYFPNWGTYNAAHHNFSVSMIPWEKTVINHSFYSKGVGTYTYLCELKNAYGTTSSSPLIVTVTGQPSGDEWVPNKAYKTGDVVRYKNKLYKCLQSHTSQVGWEPENIPALWQLQ